jgi:flagellar biosynthesis protein FlhF
VIPRKFVAATSREALYKVREALGDEAIILSNKQVPGGVEIIAVSEHEMDVFAHEADQPEWSAPSSYAEPEVGVGAAARYQHWQNVSWSAPQEESQPQHAELRHDISTLSDYWHAAPALATASHGRSEPHSAHQPPHRPSYVDSIINEPLTRQTPAAAMRSPVQNLERHRGSDAAAIHSSVQERTPHRTAVPAAKPAVPLPTPPAKRQVAATTLPVSKNNESSPKHSGVNDESHPSIQHELKLLRSMLEGQLAGLAWNELSHRTPLHQTLMRWMLSAGISPELSRTLMTELRPTHDITVAMAQIRQTLVQRIHCMAAIDDIVDKGGIYALVGTTGVGKTTTVAKLAARCTLKHGPQHVALLTTDSYRIGAHDQLKAYGRILSVPVYGIRDESDLVSALNDLSTRRLILIDTIGMSQRDRRLVEQVALLGRQGVKVQQLLLIAANAQASTLEDVVRAYGSSQLSGVIISKLDETCQVGSVLDILIRHHLRLCYVADGQRVPEDLHLSHPQMLVDRAFQDVLSHSALSLNEDEYPLVWK